MATIFYAHDAHPDALKRKTIAVFGYGSQGHAQALNLRESGYNVIIGLDPTRGTAQRAREDGFEVVAPAEAAKRADYLQILTPDETQGDLYEEFIRPNLTKGKVLGFSHGFNIHFKTIVPPPDVDVVMIAPKSPGHLVRRQYTEGRGVPALIAILPGRQRTRPRNSLWPMPTASAPPAPEFCRPPSRKRPKATSSASRLSSAADSLLSLRRALKPWSRPATSPRSPTSSACTRSS